MGVQFFKRPVVAGADSTTHLTGAGFPASGTAGAGVGIAGLGSTYFDTTRNTLWVNEGNSYSPYWSPVSVQQQGLWGVYEDFRGLPGTALSDTAAENILASGLRVFGQGLAETDAGGISNTPGEGGPTFRITTTDEAAHLVALGTDAGVYQPDQHGMALIDVDVTNVSAITLRGMGVGFVGTAADALDPPITCATTVATLVQDDLALMHFNVDYTDVDRWYVAHNKSDAAASMTVLDTSVDVAAAATYQRLRVEIGDDGAMRSFINKTLVRTVSAALDVDEEASPVFYLESTSAAVKSADVRRFMFVAGR